MGWENPAYSRSQVDRAGRAHRKGKEDASDVQVLENWRAAHGYVLNTFQNNLRKRAQKFGVPSVGQRLKRKSTLIDKLGREPSLRLSQMQDIAGCRVVFENVLRLEEFRSSVLASKKMKHVHVNLGKAREDYVTVPKKNGYRGVHDVFSYRVSSEAGQAWNGLYVEVQYRTQAQHAWATAVEMVQLLTANRPKFGLGDASVQRFFQTTSEMISRTVEDLPSCLPKCSRVQLVEDFEALAESTGIMDILSGLKAFEGDFERNRTYVLVFKYPDLISGYELKVIPFSSVRAAINRMTKLETEFFGYADVVLVRAEDYQNARDTFKNYFTDPQHFITLVGQAKSALYK